MYSKSSLDSDVTATSDPAAHSYPPTPPVNPAVRVYPPSPQTVHAKLAAIPHTRSVAQVTQFILTPHSTAHVPEVQPSLLGRVMAALRNHTPSHSESFTLSPIPQVPQGQAVEGAMSLAPVPLLTYHDRTPVWTARSTHGVLEIDGHRVQELGVQTSFYVAVALTYLEFLMDREVSVISMPTDTQS